MSSVSPAAVGGFVLGALGIVVAAILFFGGGNVFAHRTKAVVYFEGSVGGLSAGAPVTFRGVRVGAVSRVALVVDPSKMAARIPVYLDLERDQVTLANGSASQPMLRRLIEAGLRAKLVSQSFVTGQMLVELELDPGTPGHRVGSEDPNVPEIPAIPSDLDELRQQITQVPIVETVAQLQRTLVSIEKLADRINGEVVPLSQSAQRAFDGTARAMDMATAAVQRVQKDASSTLVEIHALAGDGIAQLSARGGELSKTLLTTDKTLQTINELAVSTNSLVALRSRSRDDLESLLRDLSASASALRDFSHTIDRDPSVFLRGRASR